MIRLATEQDIIELTHLWDLSFDDPLNYIDFIYNRVAQPSDTIVYDEAGEIFSMLTLIPVNFVYGEKSVRTVYIYGAATNPRAQGRGIMTQMLQYAEDYARGRDCHLAILVPGESYLFDYYRGRGYTPDFSCRLVTIRPGMIDTALEPDVSLDIDTITGEQVYTLRDHSLGDTPYVEWSPAQLDFVLDDLRIYDDHVAHYKGKHGESYAVYNITKRKMLIRECFGNCDEARLVLIKDLIQTHAPKSTRIQLPVQSTIFAYEGEVVRYGMAKPLHVSTSIKDMDPYMNLMLD